MERFTFEEIKTLKHGDLFWSGNDKFMVSAEPTYVSESDFYGDHSDKIEWMAISQTTNLQSTFQVTNTREEATDPMVFKLPDNE